MKLIIDIPDYDLDNVQVGSIASKMIFKAVKNGIPLEDIKAEIESHIIESNGLDFNSALYIALKIIDKHIGGAEE